MGVGDSTAEKLRGGSFAELGKQLKYGYSY